MVQGHFRQRILIWGGVVIFAFFTFYTHILANTKTEFPLPIPIHCEGDKSENFTCYKNRYSEFTRAFGVATAFKSLHKAYSTNAFVNSQCHQLTHAIGNVAAEKASDISDAFVDGDSLCWSGYYHGVVEAYALMRGKEAFQKNADRLCAKIADKERYGFNYYNCVHGLGHGVMAITKNQLFEALDLCESLTPDWERRSCYGGVFMENVMTENRNHYATYLKPDDLLYPCNAVEVQYKEECYKMQTSYALSKNGYDFLKLFELCSSAEDGYQRICAQSIGRDASGQSVSNKSRTIEWCGLAKTREQESDCYIGAVKDYVSYFHSDVQARELCFSIPPEHQVACEVALLDQWGTVRTPK